MKRIGLYLLWLLVIVESIFIATWIINDYVNREKPQHRKSTELLNPNLTRESIVRIENDSDTIRYGTGFFVAPDLIATNIHVIAHQGTLLVKTIHQEKAVNWTINENGVLSGSYENVGTNWTVEGVLAYDVKNDLAIIKVDGKSVPFKLGNSRWIKKNEPITIIGFPNKKFRIKKGHAYSIRKSDKWLRNDVNIGGGSSGSPVINRKGQVIGVHSFRHAVCNYSLASPINALKKLISQSNTLEPVDEWQRRTAIRSYAHYVNGENRFNAKEYLTAIEEFDIAIQFDPASIYGYSKRGAAYTRLAEYEFKLGFLEKAKKLYEAAIVDYSDAIKNNPKCANAYSGRANAYYEIGHHTAAFSDYKKSIQLNSKHETFLNIQGINKIEQGDLESKEGNHETAQNLYEDAVTYYNFAIKRNRKSEFLYLKRATAESNLGRSLANQGDAENARTIYQRAIEDCNKAITLSRESASPYYGRAHAQYQYAHFEKDQNNIEVATELFQDAIKDWRNGIDLQPDETFRESKLADSYRNIGISLIELADIETQRNETGNALVLYSSAIDDLSEAIQLNPKNAYAYSNRAWVYYLLGKHEMEIGNKDESKKLYEYAIIDCDKSSQINPNNAFAFHNRGVVNVALGNISAALIDFERAIFLNRQYADAYYQRGLLLNNKTDLDKAMELDPNVGK